MGSAAAERYPLGGRNTLDAMTGRESLTPEQIQIADIVRRALARARIEFTDSVALVPGAEPVVTIRPILLASLGLDVSVHICADLFQLIANGADLRLEVQDARGNVAQWVRLCVDTFEALLRQDLRIRRRRKVFGGATGAIWVPIGTGGWNGELLSYLGVGQEQTFPWTRGVAT